MGKSVTFVNDTDSVWIMAVFQILPFASGLDSVSWKQVTVAGHGSNSVSWTGATNAVIATYDAAKRLYKPTQTCGAAVGSAWKIIYESGIQQLRENGQAPISTQIQISNESGLLANPGFGMDNSGAVYQRDLRSGTAVTFDTPPAFKVGLFSAIQQGEVIQRINTKALGVTAGPWPLEFPTGKDNATLTAWIDGESLRTSLIYS
jgi:rhizosphere induced protein